MNAPATPRERAGLVVVAAAGPEAVPAEAIASAGFDVLGRPAMDGLAEALRLLGPDAALIECAGDGSVEAQTIARLREDAAASSIPFVVLTSAPPGAASLGLCLTEWLTRPVPAATVLSRLRANVAAKRMLDSGVRRSERAASLLEISRALNSTLDSGAILYFIARKIGETMELARCSFIVPDLADGIGRVIACKDDPNIQSLEINLGNYPEIIQVLRTGRRVIIADVEKDPIMAGVRKFADVFRDQSIMTLPLLFQNEIVGVLQIRKKSREKGFAPREIEYCELLANAAANALKNAQLYEDIEKHNAELRRQKRELEDLSDELQKKNAELIELQQLKEDFTAMIVHDLRSPLMIVQGVLDLLHYKHQGRADERELIQDGIGVTKKMLQLIANLLEVSKLEAGELQLRHEDVDLGALARAVVEPFRVIAQGRGMDLRVTVQPGLPTLRADRGCLDQILDNLLSNALKFTRDGGSIEVRVERDPGRGDRLLLAVSDSGIGIAPGDQSGIFKKFRQAHGGSRKGTGLGLTIVELLVAAHGGSVAVESEPGKGSCFKVSLPLVPAASTVATVRPGIA